MVTPDAGPAGATGAAGAGAAGPATAPGPAVVLIGPMGSGKSTVARALGRLLEVDVLDTDDAVERRCGAAIPELFATRGETAFRQVEHEVVTESLTSHAGVLALGGGAPVHPATAAALRGHRVVFLDVDLDTAAGRAGFDEGRPLLQDDPRAAWQRILEARRATYESLAALTVDTAPLTPAQVADRIVAHFGLDAASGGDRAAAPGHPGGGDVRIPVGTGDSAYEVLVGHGLTERLPGMLGDGVRRVLLVHSEPLAALAEPVRARLDDAGYDVHVAPVADAEAAKTLATAGELFAQLGRAGFTRTDAVVAVGGGSVTDLAGFVAATWLRGVRVVHLPTTVLGMVDAAVGGKTGVNTDEGKNLVGSFHPPAGVLCDLDTLRTLPASDTAAGLAEVVKTGFIADERILEIVEADPSAAADVASPQLAELVARSIAVKARVVTEDLKESSLREILNYGHTFAHAIEQVEHYTWRHGDAVAVGMMYAATLAVAHGHGDAALLDRHRRILASLGLPTTYPAGRWGELLTAMRRDKKTRGSLLRFVVLDAVGRVTRLEGPTDEALEAAYARVSHS